MEKGFVETLKGATTEAQQRRAERLADKERAEKDEKRRAQDAERKRIARFVDRHLEESVEYLAETASRKSKNGEESASLVWTIKQGLHSSEPTAELQKHEALGKKVGERFAELGFEVFEINYQESTIVQDKGIGGDRTGWTEYGDYKVGVGISWREPQPTE